MTEAASQPGQKAAKERAHIAEARMGPPNPIVASKMLHLGFTMAEMKKGQECEGENGGNREAGGNGRCSEDGKLETASAQELKAGGSEGPEIT